MQSPVSPGDREQPTSSGASGAPGAGMGRGERPGESGEGPLKRVALEQTFEDMPAGVFQVGGKC